MTVSNCVEPIVVGDILFFICKGEKMVNYIFKFFHIIFLGFTPRHTLRKIENKHITFFILSTIFVVFSYRFVEIVFASDEVPELSSSTVDTRDGVVKPMELFFLPVLVNGIKTDEFINNGCFKFGSSGKEFLPFHNSDGVVVGRLYCFNRSLSTDNSANPSTKQTTDNDVLYARLGI